MLDILSKLKGEDPLVWLMKRCEGAYAPRTLAGYRADLKTFRDWCEARAMPWLPACPETVAEFVDAQVTDYRISTIKRRVVAIGFAHRMMDLPNPVDHSSVFLAQRRAKRTKPQRPDQVRPLTHRILEEILDSRPEGLARLRDAALVGVGYDTLCRSTELAAMRLEHLREEDNGTTSVLIPRSKADSEGKGRIAYLSPRTVECLDRWLRASRIASGPLFRGLHLARPSGCALSTSSIRRIVKRAAGKAGVPASVAEALSGHSMRVGAAQDMLVAGFDMLAIMQAGGWTSPNIVLRYVENAATRELHERRWAALAKI